MFTEKIFGWYGMGEWFVRGTTTQDINIVLAIGVFAGVRSCWPACCQTSSTHCWTESAGDISQPVTTDSSTTAKSGVDVASFASRRTLVFDGSCATNPQWCRLPCSC